jgi:hypothetical protein
MTLAVPKHNDTLGEPNRTLDRHTAGGCRVCRESGGFCQFCPHLRAYGLTANRGKIKRDALVTPTQLSPALINR